MRFTRPVRCLLLILLAAFLPALATAQSPLDPAQLPARTIFYVMWHGTPPSDVRAKNSLYALWDDPDLAPARSSFAASLLNPSAKDKDKPTLTRDELTQYLSLLDNPFLVGYIRGPELTAAAKALPPKERPAWKGMFLVYDRTGKEDLLSKAVLRLRGTEKEIPKLSTLTVAGVPALKVERKTGVNYWAEFNKYAVSAEDLTVFEEILNLLNGKPAPATLGQNSSFVEAKPLLSSGLLEFFVNTSHLKELALNLPSSGPSSQFKPFLNALKLDSLHAIAGHVVLDGPRTRMQAGILGDAAPGGLFDIFAAGQPNPVSSALVSPDTVYYSESQVDLPGIYKTLRRAFLQASPNSEEQIKLLDSAATTRLGMSLDDALGLTTGEFASLQTSPSLDKNQNIYFLGIRSKPEVLKLIRSLLGDRVNSERTEGTTTFLKISLQGGQNTSGTIQWNFYYLALTPNSILGASKTETLRKYLDRSSATSADPAPPTDFQARRAKFPEKLSGLTYLDFQKVDWAALKAQWIADANKAAHAAKSNDAAKTNADFSNWLTQVDPAVFPRHLHVVSGASWKDAKGIHIDETME